ncbi:hypothetical protein C3747_139g65 [Trypanosoma cruzi]|uniref:J domain-containing protein n=2 Tax=Trypanosoma cruzi TaxID=5693 RepID=Q4DA37_TRYCC|nr:hypothetical protein, conserved [Trypanosoma cruzi]EAN89384.1 hypothetical protein, conserved [Trypanosoma cruzi]PWV05016.1 hypothetical protein C3747_139g65 [Trypanosoma cruzi]|eukprot:XP_811235.1 hypothetical protein [Trypanosoma cruzi strain CL Brener]
MVVVVHCGGIFMYGSFKHVGMGGGRFTSAVIRRVVRDRGAERECAVIFGSSRCTATKHTVSSEELRAALRVFSLPDDATDGDIKFCFQKLAKSSHPDVLHRDHSHDHGDHETKYSGVNAETLKSETTAADKMRRGVEAYRLLRQYSREERRMILSLSRADGEAQQRAQRAYEGQSREQRQGTQDASNGTTSGRGRRPTAEFNNFQRRMERMREEAPPWNVSDRRRRREGALNRLSFMFGPKGHSAQAAMDRLFREYQRTGGLGDGLGGDPGRPQYPPNSFASTSAAFSPEVELQFMQLRKQAERAAVVDAAVGYRLVFGIFALVFFAFVCMVYATVSRQRVARRGYYTTEASATSIMASEGGVGEKGHGEERKEQKK